MYQVSPQPEEMRFFFDHSSIVTGVTLPMEEKTDYMTHCDSGEVF